jgi:hypothetical protein
MKTDLRQTIIESIHRHLATGKKAMVIRMHPQMCADLEWPKFIHGLEVVEDERMMRNEFRIEEED